MTGESLKIRQNRMQFKDPILGMVDFDTQKFYDIGGSSSKTFSTKNEPLLRGRTQLNYATEEVTHMLQILNLLDVIAQVGGLSAGLAIGFGCCLFPAARLSYEVETMERVNGVELSCSDSVHYGCMLLGCRACCSLPKLEKLEEAT